MFFLLFILLAAPGLGIADDGYLMDFEEKEVRSELWSSGYVRFREPLVEGKKEGLAEYFYPDGTLYAKIPYKKGKKHGRYEVFSPSGARLEIHSYKNGVRHGYFWWFHANGIPRAEEEYADGKLVGSSLKYYPNGYRSTSFEYDKGVLQGRGRWFYANGKLKSEVFLRNNQYDGIAKWYSESGRIIAVASYVQGEVQEMGDDWIEIRRKRVNRFAGQGWGSSKKQIQPYEVRFSKNASDIDARAVLLGYHARAHHHRSPKSSDVNEAPFEHYLWFVRHSPEAVPDISLLGIKPDWRLLLSYKPFLPQTKKTTRAYEVEKKTAIWFERARRAWDRQLEQHPRDVARLENAAKFFWGADNARAEQLLRMGQSLEPTNPNWEVMLASISEHRTMARKGPVDKTQGTQLHRASLNTNVRGYRGLASKAFQQDDLGVAGTFAIKALRANKKVGKRGRIDPDTYFHAHTVLGRIALRVGDIKKANQHLLQSIDHGLESRVMMRRGPDFTLARELLKVGQETTVIQFLKNCTFWDESKRLREHWIRLVRTGRIPREWHARN